MEFEKYVDESWKESTADEKEKLRKLSEPASGQVNASQGGSAGDFKQDSLKTKDDQDAGQDAVNDIQITFMNYVTSLGYQALIFLGDIPNPVTNETDRNLDQAKFLIDTLIMLKEKTKGNLNSQEENLINATTYELQLKYVELKGKES